MRWSGAQTKKQQSSTAQIMSMTNFPCLRDTVESPDSDGDLFEAPNQSCERCRLQKMKNTSKPEHECQCLLTYEQLKEIVHRRMTFNVTFFFLLGVPVAGHGTTKKKKKRQGRGGGGRGSWQSQPGKLSFAALSKPKGA